MKQDRNSSFLAVYRYEWRQMIRNRAFLILTLLILLAGLYSIVYGTNEVVEQQKKIELLESYINHQRQSFSDSLFYRDTTASSIGEDIGILYANHPDGLSALSFGLRDIHKFTQQLTNESYFYAKYASGYVNKTLANEIVNPFKLLAGHMDMAFTLLFLFPLYFILLSYNILSAEKEGGTLALLGLHTTSAQEIIIHKLLFRFLITVIAGMVLLLIAAIVNHLLLDIRWWMFCIIFIAYLFCWAGMIALLISLNKNSGFNALALVSLWLIVVLLLPSLLNTLLNKVHPVSTRIELAASVQKANAEIWALSKEIRVDSFKTLRPYYANSFDSIGGWDDPKFFRVNHYLTDYNIVPSEQKRIADVVRRNLLSDKLNIFSPVLLAQSAFNELAAANMQQMLAYDTGAYTKFKQYSRFIDDYIFLKDNRFNKEDFKLIPVAEFRPVIRYQSVWFSIVLLIVTGLFFFFFTIKKISAIHFY